MRNKLFYYLCWLTAVTGSLQAQAQNKVVAPMKDVNQVIDNTLDSLNKARTARPIAGSSRKGDNPVLFLVGNSTMRTGTLGNGNNGQWGWGFYAGDYFDPDKITVENHALGGTSSRTFYNRLWPDVIKGVRPGDWVIIELGHNDNGPYDSGRARASIPGVGTDSLNVTIKETGVKETVYTYGEYMRRFIRDVKAKGGHPILFSLTPRYAYEDKDSTIIKRVNKTNKNRLVSFDLYGSNQGNHGTKYNPCYYGDFLGDYREEVILGSSDYRSIYIFSTNHPTTHRLRHLMTDHNYDMSQAMQNMGYNQGTNLGYYVGAETMK